MPNQTKKRTLDFQMTAVETNKRIESDYYVEGYATTFEPYVLFRDWEGNDIYEQIDKRAFEGAEMSDVIMQFDHNGRVYARMSNNTLGMEVDDHGLFIWADLSKTENSRNLYEDIKAGMITKMSWAFTVESDGEKYDPDTRTIHVNKVRQVFDVSAVSIPANDQTSISARKSGEALVREFNAKQEAEKKRKKLALLLDISLGGK